MNKTEYACVECGAVGVKGKRCRYCGGFRFEKVEKVEKAETVEVQEKAVAETNAAPDTTDELACKIARQTHALPINYRRLK